MILKHLPATAATIAEDQGWDSLSIGMHLLGFIQRLKPNYEADLATFFREIADEENDCGLGDEGEAE